MLSQIQVGARKIRFRNGDILLCYTDGVTEAVNEDLDEFGIERMILAAGAARKQGAAGIVDEITGAITGFAGEAAQHDDITLVVMKREVVHA